MKVGRIASVLEDINRKETLGKKDEFRKIIISFYYPVDDSWKENHEVHYMDLYHPKSEECLNEFGERFFNQDRKRINHVKSLKINIYNHAPISKTNTTYPVIIQSTGLGAPRDYMTYTIEDLIKAGYVVFTIGHFYDSMLTILPNGEWIKQQNKELTQEEKKLILEIRKDDILFLLDSLPELNRHHEVMKNKLDLDKIGVIGHSLGGAAMFKAAQNDNRIKSIVLYDASLQFFNLSQIVEKNQTLNIPVLNFRRDHFDYETAMKLFIDYLKNKDIDAEAFKKGILINDEVLRDSKIEQKNLYHYINHFKSFIKLKHANHITFTDYPLLMGEDILKTYTTINEITVQFLNEFLCGKEFSYQKCIENNERITMIDENGDVIIKRKS